MEKVFPVFGVKQEKYDEIWGSLGFRQLLVLGLNYILIHACKYFILAVNFCIFNLRPQSIKLKENFCSLFWCIF